MQLPIAFFLGANTPRGFLSLFPCLAEEPGLRLSPLKTGPGCGKSTFLRSVADWEEPRRTELFYCSSDPSSLDGVLLHSRNLAVLDGTAPHLYDPPLPGAQGEYLLFPPFLDAAGLAAKRQTAETPSKQTRWDRSPSNHDTGKRRSFRRSATNPLPCRSSKIPAQRSAHFYPFSRPLPPVPSLHSRAANPERKRDTSPKGWPTQGILP